MRKTFLLILVFLFFAVQAQSADQVDFPDIYIDVDVGDGGAGSQADPYNGLTDINWTTGGDNSIFDYYAGSETASVTINLQKGDTWTAQQLTVSISGSASYPIMIQSYGTGADPIIDGDDSATYGIYVNNVSYIAIDGIEVQNTVDEGIRTYAASSTITNIIVRNCEVSYTGGTAGIFPGAADGYEIQSSEFYNNIVHHSAVGIYPVRMHDSKIYDSTFHTNGDTWGPVDSEEYGIGLSGGDDNEFYGNTIYKNEGNCIHIFGSTAKPAARNKFYNNHCYNNLTDPTYVTNSDYYAEVMVGGEEAAGGVCDDNEIYNNRIQSDYIGVKNYGTGTIIKSNLIYSDASTDIGIDLSGNDYDDGSKAYSNTVNNFAIGIEAVDEVGGFTGLDVKNNIISSNTTGIVKEIIGTWDYNLTNNTTDYSNSTNAPLISPGTTYGFFGVGDGNLSNYAGASPAYKITLTDNSAETLVGYIGEADASEALGTETIDVQKDRDFSSGTIGNWTSLGDGTCAVDYNTENLGGADNKQAVVTSTDDTYCDMRLTTSDITIVSNRLHKITANLYVKAANTLKTVRIRAVGFGSTVDSYQTLPDDTWTELELYRYIASDTTGDFRLGFYGNPTNGDVVYIDDISIKPVNSIGTDGVVIYTTSGLSTEGWVDSGSNFDWQDTEYDIAFDPAGGSNDVSGDPLFSDSGSYDFSLLSGSAAINAGVDLGDSYDDGLNPTSTWPDGVLTIDQDDYGNWDIGAYVWPGILHPMGFRIIGWSVF